MGPLFVDLLPKKLSLILSRLQDPETSVTSYEDLLAFLRLHAFRNEQAYFLPPVAFLSAKS